MKASELRKSLEWCEEHYGDLPVTDRKLLQFNCVDMVQDCNGAYLCFKLMDRDYTDPKVSPSASRLERLRIQRDATQCLLDDTMKTLERYLDGTLGVNYPPLKGQA